MAARNSCASWLYLRMSHMKCKLAAPANLPWQVDAGVAGQHLVLQFSLALWKPHIAPVPWQLFAAETFVRWPSRLPTVNGNLRLGMKRGPRVCQSALSKRHLRNCRPCFKVGGGQAEIKQTSARLCTPKPHSSLSEAFAAARARAIADGGWP